MLSLRDFMSSGSGTSGTIARGIKQTVRQICKTYNNRQMKGGEDCET